MSEYLPKLVGIDKACEWLAKRTGDEWSLERLLECGLSPYFWLDWTEDTAPIFSGRTEGMLVYACFASDSARLVALGNDFRVTTFVLENDNIVKCGPPGIPVPLEEIRFKREDLIDLASKTKPIAQEVNSARLAPYREHQESGSEEKEADTQTPMRLRAILNLLEFKYPALEHDFNRREDWIKECSTGKRGEYYFEKVKAGCAKKWGDGERAYGNGSVATHKLKG